MIGELKNLSMRQAFMTMLCFLGSAAPGVLVIFLFDNSMFMSLDTSKLLLLSLAITLPIVLINVFCANPMAKVLGQSKEAEVQLTQDEIQVQLMAEFAVAFWITSAILYGCLGWAYFQDGSFEEFLWRVAFCEGVVVVIAVCSCISFKFKAWRKNAEA